MNNYAHEIRDPIHDFVRLTDDERQVVNSPPFQRLRHIHQLALTYLVYPGASHKRFEHSLGVMELASRVFDIVTHQSNLSDKVEDDLNEFVDLDDLSNWRKVLRIASLLHDVGHLPFSHAAEKDLLPSGWDHERITQNIILSNEMEEILRSLKTPLQAERIVKLAIGPKKAKNLIFNSWEAILSEIITGDAFGVDRMDYLLRDSHHIGVAYGRFDHYRLIDTLRILPDPMLGKPKLGIEEGGLHSVEALLLARYFMYTQVYFHPVRRIYDIHLMDFLKDWLEDGQFSTEVSDHLNITDNEVTAALVAAARNSNEPDNLHADRIVNRNHFKLLYKRNPNDFEINPAAGKLVFDALSDQFGPTNFRYDKYQQPEGGPDFPVLLGDLKDEEVVASHKKSEVLNNIPVVSVEFVFCERETHNDASDWLNDNREKIIKQDQEEN